MPVAGLRFIHAKSQRPLFIGASKELLRNGIAVCSDFVEPLQGFFAAHRELPLVDSQNHCTARRSSYNYWTLNTGVSLRLAQR